MSSPLDFLLEQGYFSIHPLTKLLYLSRKGTEAFNDEENRRAYLKKFDRAIENASYEDLKSIESGLQYFLIFCSYNNFPKKEIMKLTEKLREKQKIA